MSSILLCMTISAFGGCLTSSAYNLIPCFTKWGGGGALSGRFSCILYIAYVILNMAGILCAVIASKFGPVAVAMPCVSAAGLFSNMFIQSTNGLAHYNKAMRVGTIALVAAAACLGEVGPTDPAKPVLPSEVLRSRSAITWGAVMFTSLAYGTIAAQCRALPRAQAMGVLAYVVACSTAVGTSIGKLLTLSSGFYVVLWGSLYLCMGVLSLGGGAKASVECDMALFLPMSQCMQLMINALTGLFVWGDGPRVRAPLSYLMVLLIVCLSVYLNSSYDIVEQFYRRRRRHDPIVRRMTSLNESEEAGLATDSQTSRSSYLDHLTDIEQSWEREPATQDPTELGRRLRFCLDDGLQHGSLEANKVTELCGMLVGALAASQSQQQAADGASILKKWHAESA
mmetsp:Transcript_37993/g.88770  ORF Transcript_37993/g.88770 Transcript_37993/m.88770 type:complete len:397 (-) Transcript_37993:251-1441(-)